VIFTLNLSIFHKQFISKIQVHFRLSVTLQSWKTSTHLDNTSKLQQLANCPLSKSTYRS